MQSWQNSLRVKINQSRLRRYWKRRGQLAAKNELRETQAWCAAKADLARPKDCFRDERLRPPRCTEYQALGVKPDCVGSIGIRTVVQAGINVVPEQCVLWLDDCSASLQQLWNKVVMTEQEEPRLLKLN